MPLADSSWLAPAAFPLLSFIANQVRPPIRPAALRALHASYIGYQRDGAISGNTSILELTTCTDWWCIGSSEWAAAAVADVVVGDHELGP